MDYKYENIKLIDFVKTLSAYRGLLLRKLLRKLNEDKGTRTNYSSFYNKLKNSTLEFREMNDIASVLGYNIIFKDIH